MGDIKDQFDKILEEAINLSTAVIRKQGSQWCIFSKSGKKLGCYPSKKQAQKRLREIEFFKSKSGDHR